MPPTHPVQLGRYEILEEIGRGAMGLVYLAKDPLIGRLVALKTLRLLRMTEDEEIEQFRRRFIREAQSAGILSHPNIVTIHDVVDEPGEGGATFIAMEYIRGTDLKQLILEQGALDLRFIVDVVRRVASALDYAHSRGVVHRDVKPANVLITGEGEVKITDFGIARLNTSNLTLEHELLGTPNYMAPEQILGTDSDHRADIFSLGVLLYEMLTGQKPFTGDNLTSVTHNIVYEPFTPPDEHVSHLPPGIGDILTKALAKKPEDRYASAGELATALAEVVKAYEKESSLNETRQLSVGPLVPAKQGGSWRTSRMWRSATRRPPVLRSIAVAGIAALVVLLLSAWWVERLSERHEVPPDQVFAQERLAQYLDLLREGRENLEGGDPVGAVESLRRAERLAPERPEARALRERAEIEADSLSEVQRQVSTLLRQARDAIREQQFTEAVIATDAALSLAPGHEVATQLQDIAIDLRRDQLQEAERRRLAAREAAEPSVAAAEEEAAAEEQPEPPPVQGEAVLVTSLVSRYQDEPVGSVTVWLDGEQVLHASFRFIERTGFLGLGREAYDGRLDVAPVEVPSGEHTLLVHVTPKGKAARAETTRVRFEPGEQYRLSLNWSRQGELSARLE